MLELAIAIGRALLGNQWTRLAFVGVLAFGTGWVKGWFAYPRPDIPAIQRAAADARDSQWRNTLDVARKQDESRIEIAVQARDTPEPVDATVASLCSRDRDCKAD